MRSQAERSFAGWLNEHAVPFEYEPRSFNLPNGERYVPDFWLPVVGVFIEVKAGEGSRLHKPWILAHTIENGIQVYLHSYGRTWVARPLGWSSEVMWLRCDACGATQPTEVLRAIACRACSGRDLVRVRPPRGIPRFRKKDPVRTWQPRIPDKIAAGLL